jgi:hypothetical protein
MENILRKRAAGKGVNHQCSINQALGGSKAHGVAAILDIIISVSYGANVSQYSTHIMIIT